MQIDWTISIGNLITTGSFIVLAIIAWRDLTWRIKNLETWRKEHLIDDAARDTLIHKLDRMYALLHWQTRKMGGAPISIESTDSGD